MILDSGCGGNMLPWMLQNGIVISKIPVMQAGLKEVMRTHFLNMK